MTAEVQDCTGPDWLAGRALLEHHARTGQMFTSNQIRSALRDLGFGRYDSGALFMQAKNDGLIRKVGVEVSTDGPTHGAYVRRWLGCEHRTPLEALIPSGESIPVRRDPRGKFTTDGAGFEDVPLFEMEQA